MKKLILIPIIACLTGCNTTTFKASKSDGTIVEIRNSRVWWSTEAYAVNLTTNGASLTASKSTVDSAAIGAAVTGAVDGTLKALGK